MTARWLAGCAGLLLAAGCASFNPRPQEHPAWQQRAKTMTQEGVTMSVAVLTADETEAEFGVRLDDDDIQPVWVKLQNTEQGRYFIPPISIDGAYYSPLEAAWTAHGWFATETNDKIDRHIRSLRLPAFVEPGATVSGFVLTPLDQGTKFVSLELIGTHQQSVRQFSFLVSIPGLHTDFQQVQWDQLYAPGEVRDLDEDGLHQWLEKLPACTKGGDKQSDADGLNVVLVGAEAAVFPTLARRGWHVTESIGLGSTWETIQSSLFGSSYRYAPVSSLYLFGRRQDFAVQKPRGNVNQRNHMRLWLAPVTVNGTPVWVGQISRDIGVRLSRKTITTHKIDPDIDETRWYLLQDMFFSQGLKRLGWVRGMPAATPKNPRHNYTGDPYFTDGLRVVLWMSDQPVTYQQIEGMHWESPSVEGREPHPTSPPQQP